VISKGNTVSGRSLLLLIVVFVCAGICVYQAREYAIAAPTERTTTAHVISVYHSIFRSLRFDYYSCSYNFSIDGSLYIGLRDCPQWIIDEVGKGKYLGSGTVLTGTDATVYYDPSDPSVNSLLEFSAESQILYRCTAPWVGIGALIVLFFVFGRLLATREKRGKGGVVVDARGTVIYPEEIGLGSNFARLPNRVAADAVPPPALRELYLDAVNEVHPDRAAGEADRALRERLMKEANAAFERGDAESLRRVLEEYRGSIPAS
jgi:hypothetical protein